MEIFEWKICGNNWNSVEICWKIFDFKGKNLELERDKIYEVDII